MGQERLGYSTETKRLWDVGTGHRLKVFSIGPYYPHRNMDFGNVPKSSQPEIIKLKCHRYTENRGEGLKSSEKIKPWINHLRIFLW